ncbi:MAG TPA: hypothetical protein VMZ27_12205, partial [Candidatus Saccharimonadales bacterium]|nr:hypothetical protein [Candidatus Saccharimonadales bacterium]
MLWKFSLWIFWACLIMPCLLRGELVINEILLNPPGSVDIPNEYLELRGTPNMVIPLGTYFVCVEGDTNGNPGTIQNVFDLSGRLVGGNGFLVLLQKTNSYSFNTNATILVNIDTGIGFGSGSSSSIEHRGEGGQTDLENGSETFFLIQSTNYPTIGLDIDSDNNGVPEGSLYASWVILDSVGILGNGGLGDMAYGAINFRRNPAALASGTVVPITFNASYVARTGNTSGSAASAWVAGDNLGGTVPNWTLGSTANTAPPGYATMLLNHIGAPNFGAPPIPGVIVWESGGSTDVREGIGTDFYTIFLNTAPSAGVTIQIVAEGQVQISVDNGASYGSTRTVTLTTTSPKTVLVRALVDDILDTAVHPVVIRQSISSTLDATHYATTNLVASVIVNVTETRNVLLSEIKANPPGPSDGPYEYAELRGQPTLLLTNLYFVAIDGNASANPGVANVVINLSNMRLGSSGLLVLGGFNCPYPIPFGSTFFADAKFDATSGILSNDTVSFLLISSPKPILEGADLDAGDNGILEGLSKNAMILDAVGWSDGDNNDIVYGGVALTQMSGVPDAASRFEYDNTPLSATAWYNGDLLGPNPESIAYDDNGASANFPYGAELTPGVYANLEPSIAGLRPFSGVVGDPTNPGLTFQLRDPDSDPSTLQLSVFSSNQVVVPNANLSLTTGAGGFHTLFLNPLSVGYSWIRLIITDDDLVVTQSFLYAASGRGPAGTFFHSGMSDASAAFALDANYMWVGDDENQTLKLYDRRHSGEPIAGINFDSFLGLADIDNGIPREVDIEGS